MGDDERETPASSSNDQHATSGKSCEQCGTTIDTSDWYPVTKERNPDGSLQLHEFCCEDCQDEWVEEHLEDT